jgi:ankyrin repeat protein
MQAKLPFLTICIVLEIGCGGGGRLSRDELDLNSSIAMGDMTNVQQLVKAGVNVNCQSSSGTKFTPLHWAIYEHEYEIANFLLDHGANPNLHDIHGETPVDLLKQDDSTNAAILLARIADQKRNPTK